MDRDDEDRILPGGLGETLSPRSTHTNRTGGIMGTNVTGKRKRTFNHLVADVSTVINCRNTVRMRPCDVSWHLNDPGEGGGPYDSSWVVTLTKTDWNGVPFYEASAYRYDGGGFEGSGSMKFFMEIETRSESQVINGIADAWLKLKADKEMRESR